MIIWAFNLLLLAVCILVVGLIKPKWLLFWMEQPNRFMIVGFAAVLLMASAILFGEGNKQNSPLSEVVKKETATVTEAPSDLVQ